MKILYYDLIIVLKNTEVMTQKQVPPIWDMIVSWSLLTTSEILHGPVFMSDDPEKCHNSSNNRLFDNLKNILCHSNWI